MSQSKSDSYGSPYLYSEDLLHNQQYKTVQVEISEVFPPGTIETAQGKKIEKWAIRFKGKEKTLVLCWTNVGIIHHVTGHEAGDKWIGFTITLQARVVESFKDMVVAIRVIPPDGCRVRKKLIDRLGTKAVWTGGTP